MAQSPSLITLLTDFGLQDPYVGIMKGVMLSRCPDAQLVDLSHDVPAQNVTAGALMLESAWRYFPPGTIHLAVVDPGVGSDRAIIAARVGEHCFVAPDNGLLSLIFEQSSPDRIVHVAAKDLYLKPVSRTFHGRDIFAPVAAALARGVSLDDLGTTTETWHRLDLPSPVHESDGSLRGSIIYIDRFGNLVSNVLGTQMLTLPRITIGDRQIDRLAGSYADVPPGEVLAIIGSSGRLEISVNQASASEQLQLGIGDEIHITSRMRDDDQA
jgi:hypothetical protein